MSIDIDRYLVKPGKKIALDDFSPDDNHGFEEGKEASIPFLRDLTMQIGDMQERLYASQTNRILIIIQALDTGGKDGLIRSIFSDVDPQGVRVESFKVPTATELAHDFLWRVHKVVPGKGELVVFNRSHYEDVLVVRVRNLAPEEIWEKRYRHINDFENMLSDEGTLIIKFFLLISKEEQRQRLLARLEEPDKHWKFNPGDLDDRKLWSKYFKAYEDMLELTSTPKAPWWVIPSDRKWYRNLVAATILLHEVKKLDLQYPQAATGLEQYREQLREEGD